MSDEVKRTGLAIGALGITYQATIIDGKQLAFETAIDATVGREELDELLDTVVGAAKRQQAKEELPLVRQSLAANIKTLAETISQRDLLVHRQQATIAAANVTKRNPRPATEGDTGQLMQYDGRIQQLQAQIASQKVAIPHLEALIARDPNPPERFPRLVGDTEAA